MAVSTLHVLNECFCSVCIYGTLDLFDYKVPPSVDWQVDLTSALTVFLAVAPSRSDCDPPLDFLSDEVNSLCPVVWPAYLFHTTALQLQDIL